MADKLYEEEKVKAIADAIRLRNNESLDRYKIGAMDEAVKKFPFSNIPKHHYEEASRVAFNILKFKESHPNSLVFGMGSDFHVNIGSDKEVLSKTSTRHAEFALDAISKIVGADFICYGGDFGWASYLGDETLYAMDVFETNSHIPKYYLVGNHDRFDDRKNEDCEDVYQSISVKNTFYDYGLTDKRGYGYIDFDDKKVRVICLNTCDYLNKTGGHGMSYEQKDWLMRSLDLSGKGEFWQTLILSHIPVDFTGGNYNIYDDLKIILDSYVSGETASITLDESYFYNESDHPATYKTHKDGKLVYNYSGKNLAKIIANIHGHIHTNAYGKMTGNDIVRMATPNACYYLNETDKYPDHGDYGITSEEAGYLAKVQNSAKDTALTFFCIDLSNQVIYAYGYGANTDRSIAYSDAVMYTVTLNLTNVICSNNELAAVENSPYNTTLTVADGYKMKDITVTMGGVDITSYVYVDGVIDISEVTGNIVIIATAEEILKYTNLFDKSQLAISPTDGTLNTRFTDGGVIRDGSFWCMETFFPCEENDIVRVYCPDGLWVDYVHRIVCTYTSNTVESHTGKDFYSNTSSGVSISDDGHIAAITIPKGCNYFRVGGYPLGSKCNNIIVTLNQEITLKK